MPDVSAGQNESSASPARPRRAGPELLSVVVPVYNEAENVEPLAAAVREALADQAYELVFVDDGSSDATLERIEGLAAADGRVVGVALSRNFGHQVALSAGLREARGQAVVTLDGDLQHPPELIPQLLDKWREGYNVVQTQRLDVETPGAVKRWTSRAFYRVFSALCGIRLDPGMADFRLLDRSLVDELCRMREGQLFLRGLVAWMGYRKAVVPFTPAARHAGKTKYSMRRMLRFAGAGLFSFSAVPLRLGVLAGLIAALLSFAEIVYVLVVYFRGETIPGWASTMAIQSFLFGVLFVLLGLQGEYLLRIYRRVQGRPGFLVERLIRRDGDS